MSPAPEDGLFHDGEPELQVWVTATLFASAVEAYELVFRRLTRQELESYHEQTKVYATILGCPYDLLPATYDDFRDYYAEMIESLRISPASQAIAWQMLHQRPAAANS